MNGARPRRIERCARLSWCIYHKVAAAISGTQTVENPPVDTRASVNLPSSRSGSRDNGIRRRFDPLLHESCLSFQSPSLCSFSLYLRLFLANPPFIRPAILSYSCCSKDGVKKLEQIHVGLRNRVNDFLRKYCRATRITEFSLMIFSFASLKR